MFKLFCSNKNNFIELYSFIKQGEEEIDKIKNANLEPCYIERELRSIYTTYNDVSYLVDNNKFLIFIEAQSIHSRYMPLRMLMYYTDLLEKYMSERELDVHTTPYKDFYLPEPEFYVVYNHNVRTDEDDLEYILNLGKEQREQENKFLRCKVKNIRLIEKEVKNCNLLNLKVYNIFNKYFKEA